MAVTSDSLDCPDGSLASLSSLNTLMTFSWNNPVTPETTLILQNDLPLDEQLIASLPETPCIRYRVKKETNATAADFDSDGTNSSSMISDRRSQQVCILHIFVICQILLRGNLLFQSKFCEIHCLYFCLKSIIQLIENDTVGKVSA